MSRPTTVRFSDDEAQELEQIASSQGRSVSSLVQEAVRAHWLRQDAASASNHLLEWIAANPAEIVEDVPELERRIAEAFADAARR